MIMILERYREPYRWIVVLTGGRGRVIGIATGGREMVPVGNGAPGGKESDGRIVEDLFALVGFGRRVGGIPVGRTQVRFWAVVNTHELIVRTKIEIHIFARMFFSR